MRVTRLNLQNWRNFQAVDFRLAQRSFFVGPNASGKSNLLDAFRFLRDIVSIGGGIQEAVAQRGGVGEVGCFSARRVPSILLELDFGEDDEPAQWTYSLGFNAASKTRRPVIEHETVLRSKEVVIDRPDDDDQADEARLAQTALEQVTANREFRVIADFLSSVRYLHVVPQVVRDPGRSMGKDDPFGGGLMERINRTPRKTRNARLKRMEEALRVAVPQLSNLELEIDDRGVPHLRAKYNHWRKQGAWQRETRFSDGTLRLMGLIWALQEGGGPLLLEEPELSLNPGVVARLAPMIARAARRSRRQSLISTHSAELLSDGVALSEVHLLQPGEQGTTIVSGPDLADVKALMDGGIPLGEAILPKAKAKEADRLPLLDLFAG